MKREKFNELVDRIIKNEKQVMEDINDFIQDKGKKIPYFVEDLSRMYEECGRRISFFSDLKVNMAREPLPEEFGIPSTYLIELEEDKEED